MFTEINNFFTSDIPLTHTVFYRGSNTVSFGGFSRDVACMANVFSKIEKDTVILFVPDDIYLFFVYFMGLMQAGKDVILPAMLTEQNIGTLGNMTNTIVTNQHFEFPGFCLVDVSKRGADTWNFCDMDNRLLYFFTSGSTGTPKKICKTFHNLSAEVAQHNKMQRHLFEKNPVMVASIAPY
ncbi:MAG: hypothetical protein K5912_02835, partial [Alphaproteobacteria bacterium]|nr:hypothetical protein [Alphaproteobacteria bacterium]